jgi:hypothetical protein
MARKKVDEPQQAGEVEALVLLDCPVGKCMQIVNLQGQDLADALAAGWIDPNPAAVMAAREVQ